MAISQEQLDQKQAAYKAAVDAWVDAIRKEEALAMNEHSVADLDAWEQADMATHKLHNAVRKAKAAYENALREEFFGF